MAIYAIADLHLSLGTNKPMDVFKGWSDYLERLEKNWRLLISDDDTVVIAGDISWAMKMEETEKDFSFLHSLPGKKVLLKGNHDYWWNTTNKLNNYLKDKGFTDISFIFNSSYIVGDNAICGTRGWMYNSESDEDKKIVARECGRLKASINDALKNGKQPIVFLHYPPVYDVYKCEEIMHVLNEYDIKECYFGHIHGSQAARKAVRGEYEGINLHLISADYLNFCPLCIKKNGL